MISVHQRHTGQTTDRQTTYDDIARPCYCMMWVKTIKLN